MTWNAGAILTAAQLNTYISQDSTTFVPTFGNLTVGNGSLAGRTVRIGPVVVDTIRLIWGTTTSISGSVSVNSSVAAVAASAPTLSNVQLVDTSGNTYTGDLVRSSTTALLVRNITASSTSAFHAATTATVPFTWVTGDEMWIAMAYFAA